MRHSKKKKKRSRPPHQVGVKGAECEEESEECRVLKSLMEAFASVSLEEAASAYREANGDPNKAAEILVGLAESADDQATSCSSSSDSAGLSSNLGPTTENGVRGWVCRGNKHKKVIAAAGTVSSVLGKEYVMSSPKMDPYKRKGYANGSANKEDAEQFLCSMLGDDIELSMAVVRDVLGQCRYNVEKALNALLELSASSYEQSKNDESCERTANNKEDTRLLYEVSDSLTDRGSDSTSHTSESTSHTSESEIQDSVWSMGYRCRNYCEVLTGSEVHLPTSQRNSKSELPQKVLESLFNMPNSSEHKANPMNWRYVAKKMESLGQKFECEPAVDVEPESIHGRDYEVCRKAARRHWDSMKSYYQKAATAFSNGEKEHAAYLSEQGRLYNKMAREADEKASQEIFLSRNKTIENVITIDLHGQHVKQAIRLLKVHLLFGAYVRSVQVFRVITGCGSHGVGKSKLKQSVINLAKREGVEWSEENHGTILIRLDGKKEFTFLESQSDSE